MSIGTPELVEAAIAVPERSGRPKPIGAILAAAVLLVLIVAALFPWIFTSADPLATATADSQLPPSAEHLFGTDKLGRDVYTRVVYGAGLSLSFGFSATILALIGGVAIGLTAGLAPRAVDNIAMRVLEIALAFPELLVALVVIALLGPGAVNVIVAITIAAVPAYARIVRITTLQVKTSAFVEAAVALGQRPAAIVTRHVLPNVVGPLLVLATIGIGTSIIAGSSLSFLGLGPVSPTPEWGLMLSDGRSSLGSAWWIAVFPGLAITVTVISTTVVGRYLQRRFEGRLR
ncbi:MULTISPECIES: ABC transporter permease [unclassified Microbacterium]|uniref:ABC transporter permease n=1 Tax=unclassified Microbacterium TaxID=2609290 RepID=UPI00214AFC74|nr:MULTISPECIES: ABC transporter permease [unclassified Microbacterium]MCR2811287.1 ABC transporter permease [Microbacterium sp. zg.B185]WIM19445.1 ABC transporter permease [Microbacterium sp. zg-B185]